VFPIGVGMNPKIYKDVPKMMNGISPIPEDWIANLELKDLITTVEQNISEKNIQTQNEKENRG